MSTTIDESYAPETFGATVQDVKNRLLHISFELPTDAGNDIYQQGKTRTLGDAEIQQFIIDASLNVLARIYKYDTVPERTQVFLRLMARGVVADGAAHLIQSALYPAASDPNNGTAYSERLWERYQTNLDALVGTVNSEVVETASKAPGVAFYSFPLPMFRDYEVF